MRRPYAVSLAMIMVLGTFVGMLAGCGHDEHRASPWCGFFNKGAGVFVGSCTSDSYYEEASDAVAEFANTHPELRVLSADIGIENGRVLGILVITEDRR